MQKYRFIIILSSLLLILGATLPPAYAMHAEVLPSRISPGDAFVVKVEGPALSASPEAALAGTPLHFTRCGDDCFEAISAFGLDTRPGSYPITVKVGGAVTEIHIAVMRTDFPTISLTLPEKEVILSQRDLDRAKREQTLLESIWQKETPRLWKGDFILPLPTEISTRFGCRRVLNKKRVSVHKGIDMRGRRGEPVKACNSGKVVLAENLFFGGNTVILDHGTGIYSIYMHLSKFDVQPGDMVSKGQTVGLVGSTGRATGPHLHFSMKVLDVSTNPISLTRLPL
ncbi:MAG: M23 family metallopeptidase [Candidatus Sulfobium sp.]|jgi:murein DD-endopeptidase MepM/ murein hydrolase activator NlpD